MFRWVSSLLRKVFRFIEKQGIGQAWKLVNVVVLGARTSKQPGQNASSNGFQAAWRGGAGSGTAVSYSRVRVVKLFELVM